MVFRPKQHGMGLGEGGDFDCLYQQFRPGYGQEQFPALFGAYKANYFRNVADVKRVIYQLLSLHRYFPYDPSPEALKRKTDAALALLEKLNNVKVDERKLKAREGKALWQVSMEPLTLVILSCCPGHTSYEGLYRD